MSGRPPVLEAVDKITLTSTASAILTPGLIDYITQLLASQDNQILTRCWQVIFARRNTDRQHAILQAFGYSQPNDSLTAQFDVFTQNLLLAIWHQDQEAATVLADSLSPREPWGGNTSPTILPRLDYVLTNDARLGGEKRPARNNQIEQTVVDVYGLPALSLSGKEGQDYWYHNTEELNWKLDYMRMHFGGDIVRWNERDWKAGLYGDPNDWSESGSNTGWVVQRQTRQDLPDRTSRGRLPGSYLDEEQQGNQTIPSQDPDASEAQNLAASGTASSRPIASQPSQPLHSQLPVRPEFNPFLDDTDDFFKDVSLNSENADQAPGPAVHIQPTLASPTTLFQPPQQFPIPQLTKLDNTGRLSESDRKLIADYRRDFEAKEEQLRAARRQKATERKSFAPIVRRT